MAQDESAEMEQTQAILNKGEPAPFHGVLTQEFAYRQMAADLFKKTQQTTLFEQCLEDKKFLESQEERRAPSYITLLTGIGLGAVLTTLVFISR